MSSPPVPRRRCGRHDLELPVLGIGCWAFGGGEYWGKQSQQDVDEVVRTAFDHGCRFFDTAEVYNAGASERSLGAALVGLPRDQVIIGSKISPSNTAPADVVSHCEASLRRLRTDYIDLYMVHWPITAHSIGHFADAKGTVPSVTDAFVALDGLKRQGKIRWIGVSNFGRTKLAEALATGAEIAINELPYSLLARAIEFEILPYCREQGVGVLGYMSVLQGVLTDAYPNLADIPPSRRRTRHFDCRKTPQCRHGMPGAEAETAATLAAIRTLAKRSGMSTQELALKWAFSRPGITSSLCGARNRLQLQENIQAALAPLARDLVEDLDRLTAPLMESMGPSFDYYEHPDHDRTK